MPDQRWGFEDDDEYEQPRSNHPEPDADQVEGADPEHVVTVVADLAGAARAVRITRQVDPTSLPQRVVAAANAATMAALARQVRTAPPEPEPEPVAASAGPPADPDPFAAINDVLRLMDEVSDELDSFQRELAAVTSGVTAADSGGRHVTVSSRDGQVVDVSIDPRWAGAVRTSELESEILDALQRVRRMAAPGELAQGPRSAAITELNNLVRNPQAMMRRLGLVR
ncbi:MAG TPA: YbaB/EbfC family nucleoid-associated protein [Pseudonocardiaceae bacterium]|nr:YbaB/EbfC family nucleoid-associated protein [Pseudonocardiaceae bacterium]